MDALPTPTPRVGSVTSIIEAMCTCVLRSLQHYVCMHNVMLPIMAVWPAKTKPRCARAASKVPPSTSHPSFPGHLLIGLDVQTNKQIPGPVWLFPAFWEPCPLLQMKLCWSQWVCSVLHQLFCSEGAQDRVCHHPCPILGPILPSDCSFPFCSTFPPSPPPKHCSASTDP